MAISKQHADACALTAVNASCSATCKSQSSSKCKVDRLLVTALQRSGGFASAIQGTDDAVPLRIDAKQ
jgi:hypothetical protein